MLKGKKKRMMKMTLRRTELPHLQPITGSSEGCSLDLSPVAELQGTRRGNASASRAALFQSSQTGRDGERLSEASGFEGLRIDLNMKHSGTVPSFGARRCNTILDSIANM